LEELHQIKYVTVETTLRCTTSATAKQANAQSKQAQENSIKSSANRKQTALSPRPGLCQYNDQMSHADY
jgi:multidrug resistance efflux pump